jgi:hypothetical protein
VTIFVCLSNKIKDWRKLKLNFFGGRGDYGQQNKKAELSVNGRKGRVKNRQREGLNWKDELV